MEFSPKALSSRVKPIVMLNKLAEHFSIVECDPHQNAVSPAEGDGLAALIEKIWNSDPPFCDIALIPKASVLHDNLWAVLFAAPTP